MKKVTNLTGNLMCLQDGTLLAPGGNKGSSKDVEALGDRDEALRERGLIHISESAPPVTPAPVTEKSEKEKSK